MTFLAALDVTLVRPLWLLVLLLAPLFAWWVLRGRARRRAGDVSAVLIRTFLLAVVALALAMPRFQLSTDSRSVAYVLDVSESIPASAREDAASFIEQSVPLRGDEDDAAFVVFADGAAVETPFSRISAAQRIDSQVIVPRQVNSVLPPTESNLAAGLALARASFPPGGARRVVLLTDGNETRGDALEKVRTLLAEGVDVQAVPLHYRREREVHVEKLVAPAEAPQGEPVPLRLLVHSTHDDVGARIRFFVDEQEIFTEEVVLQSGRNPFEIGQPFDDGRMYTVRATVEPEIDGNPANNQGLAVVQIQGDPRLLVVSGDPQSPLGEALASGLELDVDLTDAGGLPANAAELAAYDGIVLENLAAYDLSEAQLSFLSFAVRELGIGLVCIGGRNAYGPGGYAGTPLEEVLPISSEIKQKRVLPSGALVVILHTCEFPNGNAAAIDVTKLAIRAMDSRDEFGVVQYSFTGSYEWLIELQRVADKQRLMGILDSASIGDMPSFDASMELAWESLTESDAAVKHMLVISDGDATPPRPKLAANISADRISISTILVDPHSPDAVSVMKGLADETGGRYYRVDSDQIGRLPQIFIKEAVTVRRNAWREEPFRVNLVGRHAMLRNFETDELPPLRGYTVTSLKPNAELLVAGPEDDPVLATWRAGLGEVAAWSSDASNLWATDWLPWPGYGRFFTQVTRSTLRSLARPGVRVTTDVEGGRTNVVMDALTPDGEFLDGLEVRGTAATPDGSRIEFPVTQTGRGRYEGRFPAVAVGTYLVAMEYLDPSEPDGEPRLVTAGACVPYSAENLAQRSNARFFAQLEAAGATVLDLPALERAAAVDAEAPAPGSIPWSGAAFAATDPIELWPWMAAIAAFLLVLDVAARRVRFRITLPAFLTRRSPTEAKPSTPHRRPAPKSAPKARPEGAFRPDDAVLDDGLVVEPEPDRPTTAKPSAKPTDQAGGLLGAKRRAQRRQTWEDNQ